MQLKRKGCEERKLRHAELSAEAKAEHQGWKVCERPIRARRCGSVAASLIQELGIHCQGFHQHTKAVLDTKGSLGLRNRNYKWACMKDVTVNVKCLWNETLL